nr:peroxisomal sarcosine oxidase isoform X4 [Manis javanica]
MEGSGCYESYFEGRWVPTPSKVPTTPPTDWLQWKKNPGVRSFDGCLFVPLRLENLPSPRHRTPILSPTLPCCPLLDQASLDHKLMKLETGLRAEDCETGLLLLGLKDNPELKIIQATLSRQGVEHQCLPSEELKLRFPNIRLARGEVGLLDKSGGVLYADKALRALQDAIRQLGGLVHDGEKVMEIKPGLPVMVKSTSRSYQAKSLIITAGPWTNRLLHPLGIELPLQTLRINVCYWQEKVPGSYSVSQAFPCLLGLGLSLTPYHIYGLPSGEYPGLMKVCYHHGNNADPEERDCLAAFSDIQDVQILSRFVHDHLTDLEPEPAIMEHCMYTRTQV